MILDREAIRRGAIRDMVRESEALGLTRPFSDAERAESLRAALAGAVPGADIWVFGYGSLMWNPAFHYAEKRPARVYGYHRSYCMWTPAGRGTPDAPGLTLGLDRGGSCRGIAYRIAPDKVLEELQIVWAREMVSGSYQARWVRAHSAEGPVRALTFVINHDHIRYAGKLPRDLLTAHLATACGRLGSCAEYLANTVEHLHALGIDDGPMHALLEGVRAYRGGPPAGRWEDGRWHPEKL